MADSDGELCPMSWYERVPYSGVSGRRKIEVTMRNSLIRKALGPMTIALLLCVGAATANASVIDSNLGSPAQFDDQNGWLVDGGVVAGQMLAVAFTPSQSIQPTQARLALGNIFSNLAQAPIDVSLALDSSGLPGGWLAGFQLGGGQSISPFLPG